MHELNATEDPRKAVGSNALLAPDVESEYRALLEKALSRQKTFYVWSGDWRRKQWIRECLDFGIREGIIKTEFTEMEQESGWIVSRANASVEQSPAQTPTTQQSQCET